MFPTDRPREGPLADGGVPVADVVDREDALDRLSERQLDVLVVGGGITGVGIAYDAATRGMTVGLVEREDLASGTSSRSSKLVHGGLRYLEQREFGLVYEAVSERNLLRRIAPNLVRPLGFAIPTAHRMKQVAVKTGLTIYDGMAAGRNVRRHQYLDTTDLLGSVPGLVDGIGRGGYRYYDCQTDDARLTQQVAQAARRAGALVVNHAEVTGLLRFGERVVGAQVRDRIGGRSLDVRARWVVSATGVWADEVRGLGGQRADLLRPSKGVHLAFSGRDVRVRDAALVPSGAHDGRLIFVIPWGRQVIVGTTDDAYDGPLDEPSLTAMDAGYLLHAVNASFGTALTLEDVVGAWAGLRPLLQGSNETTSSRDLSRRHAVFEEPPGFVTITGGKLTTFRRMAEDVVDRIVATEGADLDSVTADLPIGPRGSVEDALRRLEQACGYLGVDPSLAGSLLHRHGQEAARVAAFCAEHGEAQPLVADLPYLRGEVRWAARHELARTVDDVLQRRLRVSLRDREAGGNAIGWTARVLAEELGWDQDEREGQIDAYLATVGVERGVVPLHAGWRRTDVADERPA